MPVRDEIRQPLGLVHGGVYASIAESIASMATALAVLAHGDTAMGLSNATSFLRPITQGTIHALATRVHRGTHHMGVGRELHRRRRARVRSHPDDDRACGPSQPRPLRGAELHHRRVQDPHRRGHLIRERLFLEARGRQRRREVPIPG